MLQYAGLRYTSAVNAGLVNATGPLLTLGLSRALLGQPLRRVQAWGALLSLVGVYFVLGAGSWSGAGFNRGDLLVLAAVTMWSLYSISGRAALRAGGTLWVTALSTAAALPLLAVPAVWECFASPPRLQASLFLALAYIGVGPSFLAFLAWNEGVRLAGPRGAMAFYNTLPLYATVLATLFLGERPGLPQLVGGALVVAGCLLAVAGRPAAD